MLEEATAPLAQTTCPICAATDAYVEPQQHRDMVFVECTSCHVYLAERRAFRFFEWARSKGDPAELAKLARLAEVLHDRPSGVAIELHYDTWTELIARSKPTDTAASAQP